MKRSRLTLHEPCYTIVHAHPYRCSLMVGISPHPQETLDAFAALCGRERELYDDVPAKGIFFRNKDLRDGAMWLPEKPVTVDQLGTLVHETAHATFHFLCRAGISLVQTNAGGGGLLTEDEVFCYLQGYLFQTILDRLDNPDGWWIPLADPRPIWIWPDAGKPKRTKKAYQ